MDDVGQFLYRQQEEDKDREIAERITSFYDAENAGDDDFYEYRQNELLCHLKRASEIGVEWSQQAKEDIITGFGVIRLVHCALCIVYKEQKITLDYQEFTFLFSRKHFLSTGIRRQRYSGVKYRHMKVMALVAESLARLSFPNHVLMKSAIVERCHVLKAIDIVI